MTRRTKALIATAAVLYIVAVGLAIFVAIQSADTRSDLKVVQNGPAVRCVQGHDNACDKLRNRLLATASPSERQDFADAIEGVVTDNGDNNSPSGQPGC